MNTAMALRGPQVCRIAGITYRQLDYWIRTGLVTPSVNNAVGSGSHRLFSLDDVFRFTIVRRLLDNGMSLQRVRKVVPVLPSIEQAAGRILVSGLHQATVIHSNETLVWLSQQRGVLFVVPLGPVVEDIALEVNRPDPTSLLGGAL